ncbi:MAG: hypothetical protein PUC39_05075, partial [Lachnospiraceae bacterium]|nr:hypothetical protein [Lachnospiraceae bacterium]
VSFYKEWYDGNVDRNITLKKLLKENEKLWLNSMDVQVNIYDKNINKTEFQNRVRLIVKEMSKRNIIGSSRFYLLYKKQTYDELPMFLNENIDLGVCGKDFIYLDILVDDKKEMYYEYLEDEDRGVNIK